MSVSEREREKKRERSLKTESPLFALISRQRAPKPHSRALAKLPWAFARKNMRRLNESFISSPNDFFFVPFFIIIFIIRLKRRVWFVTKCARRRELREKIFLKGECIEEKLLKVSSKGMELVHVSQSRR